MRSRVAITGEFREVITTFQPADTSRHHNTTEPQWSVALWHRPKGTTAPAAIFRFSSTYSAVSARFENPTYTVKQIAKMPLLLSSNL